jgi:hypothetical protein
MVDPFGGMAGNSAPRRIFGEDAATMNAAAGGDDHARSPAAAKLRRRRDKAGATIIMAAPYKGVLCGRQRRIGPAAIPKPHSGSRAFVRII